MGGLLEAFLQEAADAMAKLSHTGRNARANPYILSWGSVLLSVLAAFSHTLAAPLLILAFSLALAALLRVEPGPLLSVLVLAALLSAVPAAPLIFSSTGTVEDLGGLSASLSMRGVDAASRLVARVVASALPITVAVLHIGWPRLVRSLGLGRGRSIDPLILVPVIIPRMVRRLASLLAAREARLVKPRLAESWRVLATAAGDMLASTGSYPYLLVLAVESRSIASPSQGDALSWRDALLATACMLVAAAWAVLET